MPAPLPPPPPAALDLEADLALRTPSGWPVQASPPPLRVRLSGVSHVLVQGGGTAEGLHAVLWPASLLLARAVEALAGPALAVSHGAVLELGAGVGLAGVAAAAAGGRALLTDLKPQLAAANAAAATAAGLPPGAACAAAALDWCEPRAAGGGPLLSGTAWEWVLVADCVYHQQSHFEHLEALAELLGDLLLRYPLDSGGDGGCGGTVVDEAAAPGSCPRAAPPPRCLMSHQERDGAAADVFRVALARQGLAVRPKKLAQLAQEGVVDTKGLRGPMELWWVEPRGGGGEAAPAEQG